MASRYVHIRRAQKVMLTGIGIVLAALFMFPIYWMLITAFKSEAEILRFPPTLLPESPTLDNFAAILAHPEDTPVLTWFLNSTFIALSFASLSVTICVLTAYPLARMRFPGRKVYIGALLGSLVIPPMVLLIPNYVIVDWLGWTDTYLAVIVPGLGGVFGVLLLRQFFVTLPQALEEAAVLDGANSWQVLRHVTLPLSKSPIITFFVMGFMGSWNDYFWPLITLYSPEMRTMPVGMATLQGRYITHYGKTMSGALLIAIPSILLFIFVQRYYVRSIAQAGMKT